MAGVHFSLEENQLLSALPRCCSCNYLIYQRAVWVLLPCTHFIYCEGCFEEAQGKFVQVTCNLCGSQYSDLDRDEEIKDLAVEISQLYTTEADSAVRLSFLRQVQDRLQSIYERYLNPPDSAGQTPSVSVPVLKDISACPAVDIPPPREEGDFQCEFCGKTVLSGSFRCECGHVDFAAYEAMHRGEYEQAMAKVSMIFGELPAECVAKAEEIIPEHVAMDVQMIFVSVPEERDPPVAKQSTSYIKFSDEGESAGSAAQINLVSSAIPERQKRLREEGEADNKSRQFWAKVLIALVVLILLYDILQVNTSE